jgi:hypothetical protein
VLESGRPLVASARRDAIWIPGAVVAGVVALSALVIAVLERGHFTFPIDDPYIHLALAKHIAEGHYGVNAAEFSAPSSSVVWPFLLAPFARLPFAVAVPVIFNTACAVATATIFADLANDVLAVDGASKKRRVVVALALAFVVGANLIGLALLGMEHSLQVLVTVWIAAAIVRDAKGLPGPPSIAIAAAIAMAPLIRYEGLGTSLLAAGYFFARGRRLPALGVVVALAGLAAFSAALIAHGLGALPTSVVAKSNASAHQSLIVTLLKNIAGQLHAGWAVILAFLGVLAALGRSWSGLRRGERGVAIVMGLALAGHLVVGRSGWFGRYEAYVLAMTYTLALGVFADTISAWFVRPPPRLQALGLAAFGLVLVSRYASIVATTPLGALNIYQQQGQVARFVHDFYKGPVAVNDLGFVAWLSDDYVLDMIGLGSQEALRIQQRFPTNTGPYEDELARRHGVRFAAIYEAWFQNLPPTWRRCGSLHLGSKRLTASIDTVNFFVLDDAVRSTLVPELRSWQASLPPGVRFDAEEACR